MINESKPNVGALGLGGMVNQTKASIGETWGSVTSTFSLETRTWLQVSQLLENNTKPSTTLTNESKPA